jgi:hypothetical protein
LLSQQQQQQPSLGVQQIAGLLPTTLSMVHGWPPSLNLGSAMRPAAGGGGGVDTQSRFVLGNMGVAAAPAAYNELPVAVQQQQQQQRRIAMVQDDQPPPEMPQSWPFPADGGSINGNETDLSLLAGMTVGGMSNNNTNNGTADDASTDLFGDDVADVDDDDHDDDDDDEQQQQQLPPTP